MKVTGYTEPRALVEEEGKSVWHGRKHIMAVITMLIIFAFGIFAAVQMNSLQPTFNGKVDVAALEEDGSQYDLTDADGAAYVIVSDNNAETASENVTFSVVFNYRGFDTMGESFVLIAALAGALCILRVPGKKAVQKEAEKKREGQKEARGIIVRSAANLFLPLACTFGGYVVLHGDTSPGGGFQGGVLIASAVLLVFLAYGGRALGKVFKSEFLHETETIAEIIYISIGLIGILVGLNFAANFVSEALHMETAVLMNHAVGYHVMAGVGCLLIMLLGMLSADVSEDTVEDPDAEDVLVTAEKEELR